MKRHVAILPICATALLACFERGPLETRTGLSQDADNASEVDGEAQEPAIEVDTVNSREDSREAEVDTAETAGDLAGPDSEVVLDVAESIDASAEVVDTEDVKPTDASDTTPVDDTSTGGRSCLIDQHCEGLVAADRCLGPFKCVDYVCRQDAALGPVCESDDPCVESYCDPATGACLEEPACSCEPGLTLRCGGRTEWSSNDPGLHPPFQGLTCGPPPSLSPVRLVAFEGRGRVRIEANDNVSTIHALEAPESPATMDCRPEACVTGASFAPAGRAIYLDAGASADFTLSVVESGPNRLVSLSATCGITREKWCADGVDDELDGLTDCADPDCANETRCIETCLDPGLVTWCWEQSTEFLSAGQGRSTNYACDPTPQPGREHVFRFRPYYSETVRFGFRAADGLSIKLLEDTGHSCRPRDCLATSTSDLWFDVVANTTYYIVVDSSHALGGSFVIDFDCNPLGPE